MNRRRTDCFVLALGALLACGSPVAGRSTGTWPSLGGADRERNRTEEDNPGLKGFADYHAHMFANEAFGGFLFAGAPFHPDGIEMALAPCQHTRFSHLITRGIVEATGEPAHGPDGFPEFDYWPRAWTMLHQQMYIEWVYRAYEHGLRLLVVSTVNSEALCTLSHSPKSCNDMEAIDRQIDVLRDMATHESSWLEIALSAADARRIVRENKLAIVISVEVDTLFNCSRPGDPECAPERALRQLDRYWRRGVRHIAPIHLADNGFGGSALYMELFAANQHFLRGEHHDLEECQSPELVWSLGEEKIRIPFKILTFLHRMRWYTPAVPTELKGKPHCNARGLTEDGRDLIRGMVRRGMIVDMEHMSERSVRDTLDILEELNHPAMLSHTWPRELKLGKEGKMKQRRSEMHKSRPTFHRIRRSQGVVGVLTNQGPVQTYPPSGVRNDCDGSSQSFAQAFAYAADTMPDQGVGLGTDFNGLAAQPHGRFSQACAEADSNDDRGVIGFKTLDFDRDGLASYGLLPDLIADLKALGLPRKYQDSLFSSARSYVEMWECAERSCPWLPE